MIEHEKDQITTSELLDFIKNSGHFSEVTQFMDEINDFPVFNNYLYEVMKRHGFSATDVIKESRFERSYFYHLLSGHKKNPSRNTVIRIAFCIHATLDETQQLLRLASTGMLYPKILRDAALIYAIEKNYSMQEANYLLLSLDLAPLYQEESNLR